MVHSTILAKMGRLSSRQMIGKLKNLRLVVILLLAIMGQQINATGQEVGTLYMSGKVVNENRRGQESTIYIYKRQEMVEEIQTTKIGKFTIDVKMQDSVALVIFSEGYVSKTLIVSTKIHPAKQKKDHAFPFFVDLYPVGNVPAPIDLERPVGKVMYQGGQFIYDTEFTKESNDLLKEFVKERRQMRVREIKD